MEVVIFGDIETAAIAALNAAFAARSVVATAAPDGYKPSSPQKRPAKLVVVERLGGPKKNIVTDAALIRFSCYALTEADACTLANLVRGIAGAWAGTTLSGIHVYRVNELAGPMRMPHPASNSPRYVFQASIEFRGAAE